MENTNNQNNFRIIERTSDMVVSAKYVIYKGGVFSNTYECNIIYDGKTFRSVDHLLMYFKAVFFNDTLRANDILNVPDPRLSKRLGRAVTPFNEEQWSTVKENYVTYASYLKFTQNENCREELLRLGENRHFAQGSRCDAIYGIGMRFSDRESRDEANWKGTNLAGKALDKVYDAIINNYEITL